MAVLGKVSRAKYGSIEERHVVVETVTGPASDTTVAAGGTADITFDIAKEVPRDVAYAGVESISGLPADVKIQSISVDKTGKKLTVTVYNAGGTDATISANSVSVVVVAIA